MSIDSEAQESAEYIASQLHEATSRLREAKAAITRAKERIEATKDMPKIKVKQLYPPLGGIELALPPLDSLSLAWRVHADVLKRGN